MNRQQFRRENRMYSGVHTLPLGKASDEITEGCIILEGGGFRGIYTAGVLDKLMMAGINLQTVVGVSAGAMNGMGYVSGDIGFSGRVSLAYRHDSRYVGRKAIRKNHGIMGFDFLYRELMKEMDFDRERFLHGKQDFYATVTNCLTGKNEVFERKSGRIFKAVKASASMPLVSKMVTIDGVPYLDGGCSNKIPVDFALRRDFKKIIVVRTRERSYRRKEAEIGDRLIVRMYRKYPQLIRAMANTNILYNETCDKLDRLEKSGRVFVIAPSETVTIKRLENDMEKLGKQYRLGYRDTAACLSELKKYLEIKS